MKRHVLAAAALALWTLAAPAGGVPEGAVHVLTLEGIIDPSAASYLVEGIREAEEAGAGLVVIQLDTPGGLDPSMRQITKEILNAAVPVTVHVAPRGARAASAGAFITLAGHVAAMAPGTNIGAAHPVNLGGEIPEEMRGKIENDAVAYIRSIAESRGRNADWAEAAVRESVSVTEAEALEKNVIDLVAPDLATLLAELDGREVTTAEGTVTLDTAGAEIRERPMSLRWRILHVISNPNIAYVLMMLGVLGLVFEVTHPGVILPGVVGAMSLIMGLYGLHTLPVNYAGLLMILLALILFVAEIKVTSYGFLTIGGIICMVLGSLMLIESPAPFLRISLAVIGATVGTAVALFLVLAGAVARVHMRRPTTGMQGLISLEAEVTAECRPVGTVFVHGELWTARCPAGAGVGQRVRVVKADGLVLEVEPLDKEV